MKVRLFARHALAILALVAIVVGSVLVLNIQSAKADDTLRPNAIRERTTASSWGWKFDDPPFIPHYGASFRGSDGADPNFTGPGGNDATAPYSGGIKNWDWYPPTTRGTLLTPKEWVCWPSFGCRPESRVPGNYNAIVTR
jgi:hypothetical protein